MAITCLAACCLMAHGGAPSDELVGEWRVESITILGLRAGEDMTEVKIDESTITWLPTGETEEYKLGTLGKRKTIDLFFERKLIQKGIYGFRGGKLFIHLGSSDDRPTSLLPMDRSRRQMIVMLSKRKVEEHKSGGGNAPIVPPED